MMKKNKHIQHIVDFTGRLLAASPLIDKESYFHKSVIYIVQNTPQGTLGILINQPITNKETTFYVKIHENAEEKSLSLSNIDTYLGGPVDISKALILHSNDHETDNDKIEISSDLQVLQKIVQGKGPKMSLLALGYCSWTPGQLEQEIKDNHWFVLPSNNQTIFETSNQDKWSSALENFNISPYNLSLTSGNC